VYDMYPWDNSGRGANSAGPNSVGPNSAGSNRPRAPRTPETSDAPKAAQDPRAAEYPTATQAVQVALDRRDNGGDAVTAASQPSAGPTRQ
jgi:hypothetical protein